MNHQDKTSNKSQRATWWIKDEDLADTTYCVAARYSWNVKQHHAISEVYANYQLNPDLVKQKNNMCNRESDQRKRLLSWQRKHKGEPIYEHSSWRNLDNDSSLRSGVWQVCTEKLHSKLKEKKLIKGSSFLYDKHLFIFLFCIFLTHNLKWKNGLIHLYMQLILHQSSNEMPFTKTTV